MFTSALMRIGVGAGAALIGTGIQTGAKYLYDASGFADTKTGKWFENLFSNEKIGSALKGVGKELVTAGLGLDPGQSGSRGDPGLNTVSGQGTFPLGNSRFVSDGLNDINVQQKLVEWVRSSSKRPVMVAEPTVAKTGKKAFKKGVIKRPD
jgi:hypothetical protein